MSETPSLAENAGDTRPQTPQCGRRATVPWSLRTQLLLAINVPLAVILAVLLALDYQRHITTSINDKHASLEEEAITIHQTVLHLSGHHGHAAIQQYIDTLCGRMQSQWSSEHHILVRLGDDVLQADPHQQAPAELLDVIQQAAASPDHRAVAGKETLVVGSSSGNQIEVYVTAHQTNIRRSIRGEMMLHALYLVILGLAAAVIVNVVIWKLVARPLSQLGDSVLRIAQGELGTQTGRFQSRELHLLSRAIESMRQSLAENEQSRRIQMDKALEIQEHLLPNGQDIPGLSVERQFSPAQDVAGDYYDFLKLSDESWLLTIADVTGHGVPAAMGAAMIKALLLHAAERARAPGEILGSINRRLPKVMLPGDFASMFLAHWHPDTARLEYSSAGHEPGLLLHPDGRLLELGATGPLLGIGAEATWSTEQLQLNSICGASSAGNMIGITKQRRDTSAFPELRWIETE